MSLREEQLPEELRNAYQLKAVSKADPNKVIFGIINHFHDEAEELWEKRKILLLEHAVTGVLHEMRYIDWEFVKIPMGHFSKLDPDTDMPIDNEWDIYINEEFKKAVKRHKSSKDGLKGKLLSIGVADGFAFYEVVRVNKLTCTIEWRGFGCDRYVDRRWGYKHKIPHEEANMFLCKYLDKEK